MNTDKPSFEGWVILELMGHRRLAGYLRDEVIGGTAFLRIDVPSVVEGETIATQFYSGSAVYCITPTTEAIARRVAETTVPAPVTAWELREPPKQLRSVLDLQDDEEYEQDRESDEPDEDAHENPENPR